MKLIAVFACSLVYAVLRYLVFGNVSIANLPCYGVNKAVALSSVVALCFAAFHARGSRADLERGWFASFKATMFLHVLLSLILFSPDYYPKMFSAGKMNAFGELFMLFGVLAIFLLVFRSIVREINVKTQTLQILLAAAIALHNFFLGIDGWLKWREWPGMMPPISMISFVLSLMSIALFISSNPKLKADE